MLTDEALASIRTHLLQHLHHARYRAGGHYYQAQIDAAEIQPDQKIALTFTIDQSITNGEPVDQIQLCDADEVVWVTKKENISRTNAQTGVLYRFRLTIIEA